MIEEYIYMVVIEWIVIVKNVILKRPMIEVAKLSWSSVVMIKLANNCVS